ncbi:MAG: LytR family transcriptional regulator, partial [Chloroflexota bacterium]
MKRKQTPRKRPAVVSLVLFLGGLALFASLAALTASISYSSMRDAIATWKITALGGVAVDPAPTFSPEIHGTPAPGEPTASPDGDGQATEATSIPLPTPDPWDGASRVTILVMGLDYGDWESSDRTGPPRSDTMMLLTIDPLSLTAGMLSIPRDLWVSIPGFEGNHKINTAVRFGELYQLPGGGPALAIKTVEQVVGVEIDYFALIDFYAFEKFIDEIGGVDVEVAEEIKVDPIGPHNTVILKPGLQHLDGPVALGYARNRYTADGDFDRSRRQQQVILAIRRRILSLDMLPVLVSKAPALYQEIGAGVRTNLTLEQ